jgi:hypothetical protein
LPSAIVDLSVNSLGGPGVPMPTPGPRDAVSVRALNVSTNAYMGPLPVGALLASTVYRASFDLSWNFMASSPYQVVQCGSVHVSPPVCRI